MKKKKCIEYFFSIKNYLSKLDEFRNFRLNTNIKVYISTYILYRLDSPWKKYLFLTLYLQKILIFFLNIHTNVVPFLSTYSDPIKWLVLFEKIKVPKFSKYNFIYFCSSKKQREKYGTLTAILLYKKYSFTMYNMTLVGSKYRMIKYYKEVVGTQHTVIQTS